MGRVKVHYSDTQQIGKIWELPSLYSVDVSWRLNALGNIHLCISVTDLRRGSARTGRPGVCIL